MLNSLGNSKIKSSSVFPNTFFLRIKLEKLDRSNTHTYTHAHARKHMYTSTHTKSYTDMQIYTYTGTCNIHTNTTLLISSKLCQKNIIPHGTFLFLGLFLGTKHRL